MYWEISLCTVMFLFTLSCAAPVIQPQHEPLHEPGSFDQLLEAWEEEDGMSSDDFSPKSFFMMHDLDGNNELSPEEIAVILERELEKLNSTERNVNRTYVDNVLKEMQDYFMEHFDHNKDGKITLQEFMSTMGDDSKQHTGEWTPHEDKVRAESARLHEFEQMHPTQTLTSHGSQPVDSSTGSVGAQPIHSNTRAQPVHVASQPLQDHVQAPQVLPSHSQIHQGIPIAQNPNYHDIPVARPSHMNNNNKFEVPPISADHIQLGHVNTQQDFRLGVPVIQSPPLNSNPGAPLMSGGGSPLMQPGHPEMHQGVPKRQVGQPPEYHTIPVANPSQMDTKFVAPPVDNLGSQKQFPSIQEINSPVPAGSQIVHGGETQPVHPPNPAPGQPLHLS